MHDVFKERMIGWNMKEFQHEIKPHIKQLQVAFRNTELVCLFAAECYN